MSANPLHIALHHPTRGFFDCTPEGLDATIAEYLPNSAFNLREIIAERTGRPIEEYDGLTVSECLIILASFDYPSTA